MKLRSAAKFFDRDSVYDAYTGSFLFKGQFASYDGASPDGSFARRRTVSVEPSVAQPPRDAVKVHNELWILGQFITDGFFDTPIRKTCSAKQVTDLFEFCTPGQAALGRPGESEAYGQARYLKDTVNTPTNANYSPQYEISFGNSEAVPDDYFLRTDKSLYHVRTLNTALEGFIVATADVIETTPHGENKFVTVSIAGEWDPIEETGGPGVLTTGILIYVYKLYEHATEADPLNRAGDKTLIVAKSAVTPLAGSEVSIDDEPYRILTVQSFHDSWNLRVRRA